MIKELILIGISLLFVFISTKLNKKSTTIKIIWTLFLLFVIILIVFEVIGVFHEPVLMVV